MLSNGVDTTFFAPDEDAGRGFRADAARALDRMLSGELADLTAAGRAEAERRDLATVAQQLDRIYLEEGLDPA